MEDVGNARVMVPAAPFHRYSRRAAVSKQSSCMTGQQMTPGQLLPTILCLVDGAYAACGGHVLHEDEIHRRQLGKEPRLGVEFSLRCDLETTQLHLDVMQVQSVPKSR